MDIHQVVDKIIEQLEKNGMLPPDYKKPVGDPKMVEIRHGYRSGEYEPHQYTDWVNEWEEN